LLPKAERFSRQSAKFQLRLRRSLGEIAFLPETTTRILRGTVATLDTIQLEDRTALSPRISEKPQTFLFGVLLLSAGTLQYEVVLTRLISVVCWYYLAFVSVSMAMFGMTAGALAVQLRPDFFTGELRGRRLAQAALAMGVSLPLSMLTMLGISLGEVRSVQEIYALFLFTTVIAVPFFFAGIGICLALTRSSFPIGRVYAVDLIGASLGCLGAVAVMKVVDGPSAVLVISGVVLLSAALFARSAGESALLRKGLLLTIGIGLLAAVNATSKNPIRPIWAKFGMDKRAGTEMWSPISRVRVYGPTIEPPFMWGRSRKTPRLQAEWRRLDIDSDATSSILSHTSEPGDLQYLNYDVTSLAYQLRRGGAAAVVGIGGGRDLLTARANGFQRIVGVEIDPSLVKLAKQLGNYNGLQGMAAPEIHEDEGRSFLTRSAEKFDVVQASMVDTWAAASAGSMSLTENSLYTVEGWRIFYEHLRPGGILTVTRWNMGVEATQTARMFAVAWATLLSEGVSNPGEHLALVGSIVATILVSNRPFTVEDQATLRKICGELEFPILFLNGETVGGRGDFAAIASAHSLLELQTATANGAMDISPAYDRSPFFFNSLRLRNVIKAGREQTGGGNLLALRFLLSYLLVAVILLGLAIFWPLKRWAARNFRAYSGSPEIGYFLGIGLGFMLVEVAMIEQQSLLLGHPIYSLSVVLAGLTLSTGIGSLVSEELRPDWPLCRALALAVAASVAVYAFVVLPVIHASAAFVLWWRATLALAMLIPCGFLMGFCFPMGMRALRGEGNEERLPWMWSLNGAASVVAAFLAVLISMEASTVTCALAGAGCYAFAALGATFKR
jgi:hypothetical protein